MNKSTIMAFAMALGALVQSAGASETFGTGMGLHSSRFGVGTAFWNPQDGVQGVVPLGQTSQPIRMALTGVANNTRNVLIDSSETINGTEILYQITYRTEDGAAFLPSTYTFGGETVNILRFSLARSFAVDDKLEGSAPGIILGILDPQTQGAGTPNDLSDDRFQSTLEVFNSSGSSLGTTTFLTRFDGTGISGFGSFGSSNFIVTDNDIASATVTIRALAIPEPTSLVLLGLGALALLHRR